MFVYSTVLVICLYRCAAVHLYTQCHLNHKHPSADYLTFFNLPCPATATATATASRLRSQKLHIVLWGLHVGLVL